MYHLLELFHSEHDDDISDVDLQMLHDWLVVAPSSKIHTVSTVFFHKYGEDNVSVNNWMSYFSMFVPTRATVKMANGNTGHAQGIGIFLCHFPKLYYYISGGTSLILSRSLFQHYITSFLQTLCWFSKGCIWTYWTLWFCLPSRSFLEIPLLE